MMNNASQRGEKSGMEGSVAARYFILLKRRGVKKVKGGQELFA